MDHGYHMPEDAAAANVGPWTGFIETTGDALLILEAARQGVIPRVTRRLVEAERKMIGSGSIFVFDEEESGIRRWTDGCFWSPSRILGNFLLYRETDKKAQIRGQRPRPPPPPPPPPPMPAMSAEDLESRIGRNLYGSLTDDSKFKAGGLMKKTLSLVINGVSQHLISYYRPDEVLSGQLKTPSQDPILCKLDISAQYLDPMHFRVAPRVTVDKDGVPHYLGEAEELLEPKASSRSNSNANGKDSAGPSRTSSSKGDKRYNPIPARKPANAGPPRPAPQPMRRDWPPAYYMPALYSSYMPHLPPPADQDPIEDVEGDSEEKNATNPAPTANTADQGASAPATSPTIRTAVSHAHAQSQPPGAHYGTIGAPKLVPAFGQQPLGVPRPHPMMHIPPPMPAAASAWNGGYATYSHSTAPPPDPYPNSDEDGEGSDVDGEGDADPTTTTVNGQAAPPASENEPQGMSVAAVMEGDA